MFSFLEILRDVEVIRTYNFGCYEDRYQSYKKDFPSIPDGMRPEKRK